MKINFFNKISLLAVFAASFAVLNTSCSKVNDLYKGTGNEGEGLLTDVEVASSFDWRTAKTVDVRLGVDDKFDGQYFYKLELFDREPHSPGAVLLGAGVAKKGQDLITKITVPSGLPYVYVQKTTPTGEKSYTMLEVFGKNNIVSVGKLATGTKLASVNGGGISTFAASTPRVANNTPTPPIVPSDAISIEGNKNYSYGDVEKNKSFVIKKGKTFSGTIALNDGVKGITVYVEGAWSKSESSVTLGAGNKIVVLPEGTFNAKELSMPSDNITFLNYGNATFDTFSARSQASIANYGDLAVKNSFNVPSNTTVDNTGVITASSMYINSQGSFLNTGLLTLTGKLEMPANSNFTNKGKAIIEDFKGNSTAIITNDGELRINEATIVNTTWNVNCRTFIGEIKELNGATINIATGGRLDIEEMKKVGGTAFRLNDGAILDIIKKASFTSNQSFIEVKTGGVGVVRFKDLSIDSGSESLVYKGALTVAVDQHPVNNKYYKDKYSAESSVNIVKYNQISVVIPGTSCNGGGFNYTPTQPPVDQKPEAIELGTFSYAFEDNWPNKGDYDMNDFVVDIQVVKYQNKDNKVEKVVLKNKIRAVGASKRLAAAIQLDNVLAGAVKSVTYSKKDLVGKVLSLSGAGIEQGQDKAVVAIVDDAHAAFGRSNTNFIFTNDGVTTPLETEIVVEFATPLENFTYDDLNVFIVNFAQNVGGRHEVHMVGYKPTNKINSNLIKVEQENGMLSITDPYKTKRNYPFALRFPIAFDYPLEGQEIQVAYPDFTDWVKSGGTQNEFWYDRLK